MVNLIEELLYDEGILSLGEFEPFCESGRRVASAAGTISFRGGCEVVSLRFQDFVEVRFSGINQSIDWVAGLMTISRMEGHMWAGTLIVSVSRRIPDKTEYHDDRDGEDSTGSGIESRDHIWKRKGRVTARSLLCVIQTFDGFCGTHDSPLALKSMIAYARSNAAERGP